MTTRSPLEILRDLRGMLHMNGTILHIGPDAGVTTSTYMKLAALLAEADAALEGEAHDLPAEHDVSLADVIAWADGIAGDYGMGFSGLVLSKRDLEEDRLRTANVALQRELQEAKEQLTKSVHQTFVAERDLAAMQTGREFDIAMLSDRLKYCQADLAAAKAELTACQKRNDAHEMFRHQHRDCDEMAVELQQCRKDAREAIKLLHHAGDYHVCCDT